MRQHRHAVTHYIPVYRIKEQQLQKKISLATVTVETCLLKNLDRIKQDFYCGPESYNL